MGTEQAATSMLGKSKVTLLGAAMMSALALAGCNSSNDSDKVADADSPATRNDSEVVTVYSSRNEQLIQPLLDEFTKETGIAVELVTDKTGPLMARLEAESTNTPADMLLTVDAGNLWQAGEQGLLQPLNSEVINSNVPEKYRSAKDLWTGLSLRARTIFYDPKKVSPEDLSTYADLADPKWKGKLCLRTSQKVYNQSLVASMIEHYGEPKTEEIVKGWVANLAAPVFSSDNKMLEAIAAGQCEVGIANSYYYGRTLEENPDFPVKLFWANQGEGAEATGTHVNVSGAGIIKNADNVEGARKLIEWLSSDTAQGQYASSDKEFPVKEGIDESDLLRSWGPFKQDDINVSIFGQRQAQAVQLMDRAGYE
ncbi:extracellular solute-binding protein [Psychrobacter sp. FDAARGOS_221]|uniref:extracellular solute-binding protein n=1 Tax=Psychrobacter sp. FDAARGOS_221 TaxID=1975705 RepID=UPI000BB5880D|nr:extracellular solute-binding protein [Psychrobacter sp. FDAARGOS_221]PNK61631.1 Fe(3+) ABC transporter substrate-binding protein [Psychrobacter sp. FDAARGOS_221]